MFQFLIAFFVIIFVHFLYKYVFKVLIKINFYLKQDQRIKRFYFPFLGFFYYSRKSFNLHGDVLAHIKNNTKINPETIAMVTNIKDKAMIVLFHPQLVKEFLLDQNSYIKESFLFNIDEMIKTSVIMVNGEQHKQQRKFLSPLFNFDKLKSNFDLIKNQTDRVFDKLALELNQKQELDVELFELFAHITSDVVGRTFFSDDIDQYKIEGQMLYVFLKNYLNRCGDFTRSFVNILRSSLLPGFINNKIVTSQQKQLLLDNQKIKDVVIQMIKTRYNSFQGKEKNQAELKDFLDYYCNEMIKKGYDELLEETFHQFMILFIAGMDTTATLTMNAIHNLAIYDNIREKIINEIDEKLPNGQQSYEQVKNMEYLNAFIKECLRITSSVQGVIPRLAIKDTRAGNINIKKGDIVQVNMIGIHFNEKYYENALTFNPDRWLNQNENQQQGESFNFIPFSAGPRNCIGQHMALLETKIMLINFLRRFNFRKNPEVQLKYTFKLIYSPENERLLLVSNKDNNQVPVCTQKKSIKVFLEQDKEYYYCTCGRSKNSPFCDGSHKTTKFKPSVIIGEGKEVGLCQCKFSKKLPKCDGSHKDLDF